MAVFCVTPAQAVIWTIPLRLRCYAFSLANPFAAILPGLLAWKPVLFWPVCVRARLYGRLAATRYCAYAFETARLRWTPGIIPASAFDQDLGWCMDDDVVLRDAFYDTPCEATSCGVTQGSCPP